jgi:hypothetical protein
VHGAVEVITSLPRSVTKLLEPKQKSKKERIFRSFFFALNHSNRFGSSSAFSAFSSTSHFRNETVFRILQ